MKKVLITGGTGFVGSHMIDFLLRNTDYMLHCLKRWRSPLDNVVHTLDDPRVIWYDGDLLDAGSLIRVLSKVRPDLVMHFAAMSFPTASFFTPASTLMTNIVGTTNLLDSILSCRYNDICNPIILSVSSSEVYGMPLENEVPIKETNPIRPANPYSISKVGHDFISRYYHDAFGLKIIITRMFSHEGARRGSQFALSSFAHQVVQYEKSLKEPFIIKVGNLDSIRTYSHIEDAVQAYWLIVNKGTFGEVYNIGGHDTLSVRDVLNKIIGNSTIPKDLFKIEVDPTRVRPTDITLQIPDTTKFEQLTGWVPKKTIDDIVIDLLNYWRTK